MEVKQAMVRGRVAGAWEPFNESAYAKRHNVGFPSGTMARFTPDRNEPEVEVVKVYRRIKQGEPNWTDYVDDWETNPDNPSYDEEKFEKDHAAWVAECKSMEVLPWKWVMSSDAKRMSSKSLDLVEGVAGSAEDAMFEADRYMEKQGWVLIGSKTGGPA